MKPTSSLLKRLRTWTGLGALVGLNLGAVGVTAKQYCSPGFNCHGCPWATAACPVGVLAQGSALRTPLLLWALGFVLTVGLLLGRLVCGFLCPFGWFQDLLYRIPSPKIRLPRWTRAIKYAALVLLVFALPFWLGMEHSGYLQISKPLPNKRGAVLDLTVAVTNRGDRPVEGVELEVYYVPVDGGEKVLEAEKTFPDITVEPGKTKTLPTFEVANKLSGHSVQVESPQSIVVPRPRYNLFYCKVCPAGTLTAHIPYYFTSQPREPDGIYGRAGRNWPRLAVLAVFLVLMVAASRAFCRTFCPLGAMYGLCARFALVRIRVDESSCTGCGLCDRVCPVDLDVRREAGGPECIACGDCIRACPKGSIRRVIGAGDPDPAPATPDPAGDSDVAPDPSTT